MVPLAIGEVSRCELIHVTGREADRTVLKSDLHRNGVVEGCTEEGNSVRRIIIASEPCHEGIVLRLGAREEVRL